MQQQWIPAGLDYTHNDLVVGFDLKVNGKIVLCAKLRIFRATPSQAQRG